MPKREWQGKWQVPEGTKRNEYGLRARVAPDKNSAELAYGETDDLGNPMPPTWDPRLVLTYEQVCWLQLMVEESWGWYDFEQAESVEQGS